MEERPGISRTAAHSTICMGSRLYPAPPDSWLVDSHPASSSRQRMVAKHGNGKRAGHRASSTSVCAIDENNATVVGLSSILRTRNGGLTWMSQDSGALGGLYSVSCVDTNIAYASGNGLSGPRMAAHIGCFRKARRVHEPSTWLTR